MFTSILNFIKTVKPKKPGISSSNIRASHATDDETKDRRDLDIERDALNKTSTTLQTGEESFTPPKDAIEFTLEALRAAITGEKNGIENACSLPPKSQNERAVAAYQKSNHLLDTIDHPELHEPSPETSEGNENINNALKQIEYLADHGLDFIYVKQGQDYFEAISEALEHLRAKQFKTIKKQHEKENSEEF